MEIIIGIDLGTTNSLAAYLAADGPAAGRRLSAAPAA